MDVQAKFLNFLPGQSDCHRLFFDDSDKSAPEDYLKMIETADLFSKLKKMRILIVDDDEWIRDSLSLFFEAEGCHLLALETAEEGMAALKQQGYDIIITDYRLPGMDGLIFLEQIQKLCPNALKILITAYKSPEVIFKANRVGIHGFIDKPFTSETLEGVLSKLIAENKQKEKRHDSKN